MQTAVDLLVRRFFKLEGPSLADVGAPLIQQKHLSFEQINAILKANPEAFELNFAHLSKNVPDFINPFEKKVYGALQKFRENIVKEALPVLLKTIEEQLAQRLDSSFITSLNLAENYLKPAITLGFQEIPHLENSNTGLLLSIHWYFQYIKLIQGLCESYEINLDSTVTPNCSQQEVVRFLQESMEKNSHLSPTERSQLIQQLNSESMKDTHLRHLMYVILGILNVPKNLLAKSPHKQS